MGDYPERVEPSTRHSADAKERTSPRSSVPLAPQPFLPAGISGRNASYEVISAIARESGYPDPVLREFCEKILFSGSTKPEAPMDRVMRCSDQVMGRDRE